MTTREYVPGVVEVVEPFGSVGIVCSVTASMYSIGYPKE